MKRRQNRHEQWSYKYSKIVEDLSKVWWKCIIRSSNHEYTEATYLLLCRPKQKMQSFPDYFSRILNKNSLNYSFPPCVSSCADSHRLTMVSFVMILCLVLCSMVVASTAVLAPGKGWTGCHTQKSGKNSFNKYKEHFTISRVKLYHHPNLQVSYITSDISV